MGLTPSKEANKDLALFSQDEQEILQKTFAELSRGNKRVAHEALKASLLGLLSMARMEKIVHRLCDLMAKSGRHIMFDDYVHTAAVMVKGMSEEKAEIITYLSSGSKESTTLDDVIEFCRSMVWFYLDLSKQEKSLQSWSITGEDEKDSESIDRLAIMMADDLSFKGAPARQTVGEVPCETCQFDVNTVHLWFNKCHQLGEIFDIFSHQVFRLPRGPSICFIPLAEGIPQDTFPPWLGIGDLMLLNTALPAELRCEWKLLYSTAVHGESFSSLMGNIMNKGPTLLLIKDNKGHSFGGFASADWTLNPHFTGTEKNFVFSLEPRVSVFSSTGFNNHFQYMNIQQQTFPNGLGMGGQLDYFGLWIDAEFGKGKCAPSCTTYGCPQLSGEPDFLIERLEVWRVGPEPTKDEEESTLEPRPSILDVDMEGAAMLKMLNRGPVSEGMRESPTASSPEEKNLPPLELTY